VNEHIVIITGASPLDADLVERLRSEATEHTVWMAVDGGLDHALAAGLEPTHLVGDLDSVTEAGLAWAARHTDISRHHANKDQTDTELALVSAAKFDPERITLVGGGDRLDHTIAGIGALGALSLTSVPMLDGWWDGQHFRVVHGPGLDHTAARAGLAPVTAGPARTVPARHPVGPPMGARQVRPRTAGGYGGQQRDPR
jgi:thiamine pyrophosphokinase